MGPAQDLSTVPGKTWATLGEEQKTRELEAIRPVLSWEGAQRDRAVGACSRR